MEYAVAEAFAIVVLYAIGLVVGFPVVFLCLKERRRLLLSIFAVYVIAPFLWLYLIDIAKVRESTQLHESLSDEQVSHAVMALQQFCESTLPYDAWRQKIRQGDAVVINFVGEYHHFDLTRMMDDFVAYKAPNSVCRGDPVDRVLIVVKNGENLLCSRSRDLFFLGRSNCLLESACKLGDGEFEMNGSNNSLFAEAKYVVRVGESMERYILGPHRVKLRKYSIYIEDVRTHEFVGRDYLHYADIPESWKRGCLAPREQIKMMLDAIFGDPAKPAEGNAVTSRQKINTTRTANEPPATPPHPAR